MKKLQCNFTTPEQSKRLLELGVPADSADCYINLWNNYPYGILAEDESYSDYKLAGYMNDSKVIPCWSVGRLIEILNICSICGNVSIHRTDREVTQIEQLIEILQNRINSKTIDLSKLEE